MIKKQNGITLVSLMIVIILMLIISSTVMNVSLDRFELNNYNKMKNDLELLMEKVSNYYLKYNSLPIIRNENNEKVEYTYTSLDFETGKCYILDLSAMEGISLNYGKAGFENPNTTKDVYVINESTHNIYYVKGVEFDGTRYHYINKNDSITDDIPPSKPTINVISGTKDDNGTYLTQVDIVIDSGKEGLGEIDKTTYSINNSTEKDITTLTNNIYNITEDGLYEIKASTYDKNGNVSEHSTTITVNKASIVLDKTEISLVLGEDGRVSTSLDATLANVSKDFTWKASEGSGIIISGEGNAKTITATKEIENATITVSYGTISSTCVVTVTK